MSARRIITCAFVLLLHGQRLVHVIGRAAVGGRGVGPNSRGVGVGALRRDDPGSVRKGDDLLGFLRDAGVPKEKQLVLDSFSGRSAQPRQLLQRHRHGQGYQAFESSQHTD